jgi:hypothetical protein
MEYKIKLRGSRPLYGTSSFCTWACVVREARPELEWLLGRQIGGVVRWCRERPAQIYVRQSGAMPWRRIDDNFG